MSTFNLTAHELVFYDASGSTIRARLASHSELRLVSDTSDVPAHLSAWDVTDGHGVRVPVTYPQSFAGLAKTPMVAALWPNLTCRDVILVSKPVGQYLAMHPDLCEAKVLGPNTGPKSVVLDAQGKTLGVRALEMYKS